MDLKKIKDKIIYILYQMYQIICCFTVASIYGNQVGIVLKSDTSDTKANTL
jgi:hypothetical protein